MSYAENEKKHIKEREKDSTTRNGVWRTVLAILLRAYVAGAAGGKSEHQASQLKAPLGWRKEKRNRAKGNCGLHKRDPWFINITIHGLFRNDYKQ